MQGWLTGSPSQSGGVRVSALAAASPQPPPPADVVYAIVCVYDSYRYIDYNTIPGGTIFSGRAVAPGLVTPAARRAGNPTLTKRANRSPRDH